MLLETKKYFTIISSQNSSLF